MIHILITSGGTTIPIDPVRSIGNTSSGRFGAALATEALKAGMQVTYLTATHAQTPFATHIDLNIRPSLSVNEARLQQLSEFADQYHHQYHEVRYQTYDEYAEHLKALTTKHQPTIVMLAAAVSDYLVDNFSDNKIRSSDALQIHLKPAPKLIHNVRAWSPKSFITGFKLLVNANDAELIAAAKISIVQHDLDLCVANDLSSLQRGKHEIIIVTRDGDTYPHKQDLAAAVISECVKRVKS